MLLAQLILGENFRDKCDHPATAAKLQRTMLESLKRPLVRQRFPLTCQVLDRLLTEDPVDRPSASGALAEVLLHLNIVTVKLDVDPELAVPFADVFVAPAVVTALAEGAGVDSKHFHYQGARPGCLAIDIALHPVQGSPFDAAKLREMLIRQAADRKSPLRTVWQQRFRWLHDCFISLKAPNPGEGQSVQQCILLIDLCLHRIGAAC